MLRKSHSTGREVEEEADQKSRGGGQWSIKREQPENSKRKSRLSLKAEFDSDYLSRYL